VEFVPTIIVNDRPHIAPSVGVSSTVIRLGSNHSDASTPDIRFEQTSDTTVRITRRTRRQPLDVAMVIFRQEQAWTGQATALCAMSVLKLNVIVSISMSSRCHI
jgi:hypothetical protein